MVSVLRERPGPRPHTWLALGALVLLAHAALALDWGALWTLAASPDKADTSSTAHFRHSLRVRQSPMHRLCQCSGVAWLDQQPGVDTARGIGTQGYCMGGPFTVWSAAAVPGRIKAAASFHGGGLVRPDNPMSPHALLGKVKASLLIAVAKDDDAKAPADKTTFADAAKAAGVSAQVTVYPGNHGWMVADSPAWDSAAATSGEADLLALYGSALA